MGNGHWGTVLERLRTLAGASGADADADGPLLERFTVRRDEAAFEALLRRHGPLVLGVCRRVLQNSHDADDAFQATFLVLARKAAALDKSGSVANWLYTVAYHIALRARADATRRRAQERELPAMPTTEPSADALWRDLRPVLDEELNRLPEKHRAPVVLCYLEGKTNVEAARLLGWTKGTVSGRLARAREVLQRPGAPGFPRTPRRHSRRGLLGRWPNLAVGERGHHRAFVGHFGPAVAAPAAV
jgi:RNA polymerase sigma factor (sigma-70 family)